MEGSIDREMEAAMHFINTMGVEKAAALIANLMRANDKLLKNYEELIGIWQLEKRYLPYERSK